MFPSQRQKSGGRMDLTVDRQSARNVRQCTGERVPFKGNPNLVQFYSFLLKAKNITTEFATKAIAQNIFIVKSKQILRSGATFLLRSSIVAV